LLRQEQKASSANLLRQEQEVGSENIDKTIGNLLPSGAKGR